MLEAYDFGVLVEKIDKAGDNQEEIALYLEQLKNITGRNSVRLEEVENIRPEIERFMNEKSIVQRVWGFFTFVNIMWSFAIFGIVISIGPCIMMIIGPFIAKVMKALFDVV